MGLFEDVVERTTGVKVDENPITSTINVVTDSIYNTLKTGVESGDIAGAIGKLGPGPLSFGGGIIPDWLNTGIGELTGRNAAKEELQRSQEAVAAENARKQEQLRQERERKAAQDVQASTYAGLAAKSASARQGNLLGVSGEQQYTSDILGV